MEVKFLWLQEAVKKRGIEVRKIPGDVNPADVLTKPKSVREVAPLLKAVGVHIKGRVKEDCCGDFPVGGMPTLAPPRTQERPEREPPSQTPGPSTLVTEACNPDAAGPPPLPQGVMVFYGCFEENEIGFSG